LFYISWQRSFHFSCSRLLCSCYHYYCWQHFNTTQHPNISLRLIESLSQSVRQADTTVREAHEFYLVFWAIKFVVLQLSVNYIHTLTHTRTKCTCVGNFCNFKDTFVSAIVRQTRRNKCLEMISNLNINQANSYSVYSTKADI